MVASDPSRSGAHLQLVGSSGGPWSRPHRIAPDPPAQRCPRSDPLTDESRSLHVAVLIPAARSEPSAFTGSARSSARMAPRTGLASPPGAGVPALKPTRILSLPVTSTVVSTRSSSSGESAKGFSTKTAFRPRGPRQVSSACELCRVTMKTASSEGSSITASASVPDAANPNLRCGVDRRERSASWRLVPVPPLGAWPDAEANIDDA